MMLGMNVLNFIASSQVIYEQKTFWDSIDFLKFHPVFFQDILILCVSEAVGQLFIYFMIERFGFIIFGISLIGQRLLLTAIGTVYAVTTLQVTSLLGVVSLLFSVFVGNSHLKEIKTE